MRSSRWPASLGGLSVLALLLSLAVVPGAHAGVPTAKSATHPNLPLSVEHHPAARVGGLVPAKPRTGLATPQTLAAAPPSGTKLTYNGGDGTDTVQTKPKVYLDFWGSQWGTEGSSGGYHTFSNDPSSEAVVLQKFFKGLGGSGDTFTNGLTHFCATANTATACTAYTIRAGKPAGTALAGSVYDYSSAEPSNPTGAQLQAEAAKVAQELGLTQSDLISGTQIVLLSAHGVAATISGACGDHSSANTTNGWVTFTDLPYVTDNSGCDGTAGITEVAAHEFVETVTDPRPSLGWVQTTSGEETADLCMWVPSARDYITLSTGSFYVYGYWVNDENICTMSSSAEASDSAAPNNESARVSADFNGDGNSDAAAVTPTSSGGSQVAVWYGAGAGTRDTGPPSIAITDSTPASDIQVAAGDINHDGYGDIVEFVDYNYGSSIIQAFYGSPTGFSGPYPLWTSSVGGFGWGNSKFALADVNGDGFADPIVLYNYGNKSVGMWMWPASASGLGSPVRPWLDPPGNWDWNLTQLTTGNIDGDGFQDAVMSYAYAGSTTAIWALYGQASGFASAPVKLWQSGTGSFNGLLSQLVSGDFNGDGISDVMMSYNYGFPATGYFGLWLWQGQSNRTLGAPYKLDGETPYSSSFPQIAVSDIDGDGRSDVLLLLDTAFTGTPGSEFGVLYGTTASTESMFTLGRSLSSAVVPLSSSLV
jgi:hypothetical protein